MKGIGRVPNLPDALCWVGTWAWQSGLKFTTLKKSEAVSIELLNWLVVATDTLSPAHVVKLQQIINYREKLSPRNTNPSGYRRVCFCLHSGLVSIERDVCFDVMPAQSGPSEPGCQNQLRKQSREMQVKSVTKASWNELPRDENTDSVEKSCSQKAVYTVFSPRGSAITIIPTN